MVVENSKCNVVLPPCMPCSCHYQRQDYSACSPRVLLEHIIINIELQNYLQVGLVSGWMFQNLKPGRTICFRGVDGDFTLDRRAQPIPAEGVLLIGGGIGITPMRVLFYDCITKGIPVTLLYSVRRLDEAAFLQELQQVCLLKAKPLYPLYSLSIDLLIALYIKMFGQLCLICHSR